MITLRDVKKKISGDAANWRVYLMDFVDDFRYYKDPQAVADSFGLTDTRMDAVLASTAEYLCDELQIEPPRWLTRVPACATPYFVSGIESLKAIALVESPLRFRIRKIFVLENFLCRM